LVVIRQYPAHPSDNGGSVADRITKEITRLYKKFPDLSWGVSNVWNITCDKGPRVNHEVVVEYAGI
jgi:hypothetical protein